MKTILTYFFQDYKTKLSTYYAHTHSALYAGDRKHWCWREAIKTCRHFLLPNRPNTCPLRPQTPTRVFSLFVSEGDLTDRHVADTGHKHKS